jgi:hypothetical protein
MSLGKKIPAEWQAYDKRVAVQFNDEAYANTDTMIEWIMRAASKINLSET